MYPFVLVLGSEIDLTYFCYRFKGQHKKVNKKWKNWITWLKWTVANMTIDLVWLDTNKCKKWERWPWFLWENLGERKKWFIYLLSHFIFNNKCHHHIPCDNVSAYVVIDHLSVLSKTIINQPNNSDCYFSLQFLEIRLARTLFLMSYDLELWILELFLLLLFHCFFRNWPLNIPSLFSYICSIFFFFNNILKYPPQKKSYKIITNLLYDVD